jgi:hypothetical protein
MKICLPTLLSLDSGLLDFTQTATAASPSGIALLLFSGGNLAPGVQAPEAAAPAWADKPTRTIWFSLGSRPFAMSFPVVGPWDPRQMFTRREGVDVFNLGDHSRAVNDQLYLPDARFKRAGVPVHLLPNPTGDVVLFGQPNGIASTDGGSVDTFSPKPP